MERPGFMPARKLPGRRPTVSALLNVQLMGARLSKHFNNPHSPEAFDGSQGRSQVKVL